MVLGDLARNVRGYHTKADLAYTVLREAILGGRLAPGEHVMPGKVAEELGMSGIPVREALRRLEQEGLVDIRPHVGATVRELPFDELDESLLIRGELEALAARLAAERITDTVLEELEEILREMDEHLAKRDVERCGQLNRAFHERIYTVVPYPSLIRFIRSLWDQVPRARSVFMLDEKHAFETQVWHHRILEALRQRDGEKAGALTREHSERAREALRRHANRKKRPSGRSINE